MSNKPIAKDELKELFFVHHGFEHYCEKCNECDSTPDFTKVEFVKSTPSYPYRINMQCQLCRRRFKSRLDDAGLEDFKNFYNVSLS